MRYTDALRALRENRGLASIADYKDIRLKNSLKSEETKRQLRLQAVMLFDFKLLCSCLVLSSNLFLDI